MVDIAEESARTDRRDAPRGEDGEDGEGGEGGIGGLDVGPVRQPLRCAPPLGGLTSRSSLAAAKARRPSTSTQHRKLTSSSMLAGDRLAPDDAGDAASGADGHHRGGRL